MHLWLPDIPNVTEVWYNSKSSDILALFDIHLCRISYSFPISLNLCQPWPIKSVALGTKSLKGGAVISFLSLSWSSTSFFLFFYFSFCLCFSVCRSSSFLTIQVRNKNLSNREGTLTGYTACQPCFLGIAEHFCMPSPPPPSCPGSSEHFLSCPRLHETHGSQDAWTPMNN